MLSLYNSYNSIIYNYKKGLIAKKVNNIFFNEHYENFAPVLSELNVKCVDKIRK
jgi:hypothetical protein